jgi:hypothetical protein
MAICNQCEKSFSPREASQRFCSDDCRQAWWTAERSRAMAERRERQAASYFGHALVAEAAPAGRFARAPAVLNGTMPTVSPLAAPSWSQGPQPGTEPSLGYAIDDQEPCSDFGGQR